MTPLRTRLPRGDDGNALVEFIGLAVVLMVPLVYLVLAVFRVQNASYAVAGAAREAGRVFVTTNPTDPTDDPDLAYARAQAAAALAMADSGLHLQPRDLRITCSADPCLSPGATVQVDISHAVSLPFVPALDRSAAAVRVSASHVEVVDRFRVLR